MELLRDIPNLYPGYKMLTSLVCQTEPHTILVIARQDQTLLDCICGKQDCDNSASTSGGTEYSVRAESNGRVISLVRRPGMEFDLSGCTRRVKWMEVPGES